MAQKKPLKTTLLMLHLKSLKTTTENPEIFFNSQLSLEIRPESSYSGVILSEVLPFLSHFGHIFMLSEHRYTVANKL